MNTQSVPEERYGGCPECGIPQRTGLASAYLFQRPDDPQYRVSYGYHRDVCPIHKLKNKHAGRYLSVWEHMTKEELELQYNLLDSYAEVEFDTLSVTQLEEIYASE